MKKLFALAAAAALFSTASFAQTSKSELKADINNLNHQEKTLRTEEKSVKKQKHADRKAVRKMNDDGVTVQTKNAFFNDFGQMNKITWNNDGRFQTATFTKDGQTQTAYYDDEAELVGTTSVKSFADLPQKARKEINTKFGSYTKGNVILFKDNEDNDTDMILFGTSFTDADAYFITLTKGSDKRIYQVLMNGDVTFYKQL